MLTVVLTTVQVQQCTKIHFHDCKCIITADSVAVVTRLIEVTVTVMSWVRRSGWSDGVLLS